MKATITIEIEGSKTEIDSITNKLSRYIDKQPHRINMKHPFAEGWKAPARPPQKRRW